MRNIRRKSDIDGKDLFFASLPPPSSLPRKAILKKMSQVQSQATKKEEGTKFSDMNINTYREGKPDDDHKLTSDDDFYKNGVDWFMISNQIDQENTLDTNIFSKSPLDCHLEDFISECEKFSSKSYIAPSKLSGFSLSSSYMPHPIVNNPNTFDAEELMENGFDEGVGIQNDVKEERQESVDSLLDSDSMDIDCHLESQLRAWSMDSLLSVDTPVNISQKMANASRNSGLEPKTIAVVTKQEISKGISHLTVGKIDRIEYAPEDRIDRIEYAPEELKTQRHRRYSGEPKKSKNQFKMRKTSSLKMGKTPPGTPRKIVRFADLFGLELSDVKTFTAEILPYIPKSAYDDLHDFSESSKSPPLPPSSTMPPPSVIPPTTLIPLFSQPGISPVFSSLLHIRQICLQNAIVTKEGNISGTLRVINIAFEKSVTVRWTTSKWRHFVDQNAIYVIGPTEAVSDQFSFELSVGRQPLGSCVEFCLKFACAGHEYWDNNGGENYVFQAISRPISPHSQDIQASKGRYSSPDSILSATDPIHCPKILDKHIKDPSIDPSGHVILCSSSPSIANDSWQNLM